MENINSFAVESWTYSILSTVLIIGRIALRWRTQSFSGLSGDDFLMAAAIPLSMAGTAASYIIEAEMHGLANNGLTPEQRNALDPDSDEWRLRVKGSQTHLAGWLLYTSLLWILKLCWLFYYRRLGDRVDRMTLKVTLGFSFCAVTFLAVLFTILFGCWPVSKHWQINPDPGNFCYPAISELQAWTVVCTNLTTDLYIMTIPIPMIWRARISMMKKFGLGTMFCGGLITIAFGAARCSLILQDDSKSGESAARWSDRETFVAIILTNVPVLFPLIRQYFRHTKNVSYRGYNGTNGDSIRSRSKGGVVLELPTLSGESAATARNKPKSQKSLPTFTRYGHNESEEAIIGIPAHAT
ncbi:hypothetical protein HRG_001157 [Hirsutella rhossiliensis]|uniref:Short-chain dehydrogenase reductase sdr protein n=1 Tax=Hirsutella rhossiliensis TaxID=111463 RepID=A0A9P8N802_9HYPO|nr:putative short-chain dehydrogenase reductase sdr protein [Hirsutella rhossiliensis]KAH0968515.1 putative short-chain dehydrogenase reductase sdr protein [Hirsutella rhossiliensis]